MLKLLDCTLRDGGYYNSWDFAEELVSEYLLAMDALKADYVEIGLRTFSKDGFKGAFAYSTDIFLRQLDIPSSLKNKIGVMVNGGELICHSGGIEAAVDELFNNAEHSPVSLVRVACHIGQFEQCLAAADLLYAKGYMVGFNIMQVAEASAEKLQHLAGLASKHPIDVLYFADSMGSLTPQDTKNIVRILKKYWRKSLGIHAHDNMGNALANSLEALDSGVSWVDSTIMGMGRGPGNVKTEYLAIELISRDSVQRNLTPTLELMRKWFTPLQKQFGWGSNPYYYLAGKFGIHPSYIQEMLSDSRYTDEDILAVIEHLKQEGGKSFNLSTLEAARHFFSGDAIGSWHPVESLFDREVLILGAGPSLQRHNKVIETFITNKKPFVIALNSQKSVDESLIDIRAACHPIRLLADCAELAKLPQPLATPFHMLPEDVKEQLKAKETLDFGLTIVPGEFNFDTNSCRLPSSLVIAYALAIATSGKAKEIYLAGFDGYSADDPRRKETDDILELYQKNPNAIPLTSITHTLYEVPQTSVYALID